MQILAVNIDATNLISALSGLITGAIIPCVHMWNQSRKVNKRDIRAEDNAVIKILREQIEDLQQRVTGLETSLKHEQDSQYELIKNEATLRAKVEMQAEQIEKLTLENEALEKRLNESCKAA